MPVGNQGGCKSIVVLPGPRQQACLSAGAAMRGPPSCEGSSSSTPSVPCLQHTQEAVVGSMHGPAWHSCMLPVPWHSSFCAQQQPAAAGILPAAGKGGCWSSTANTHAVLSKYTAAMLMPAAATTAPGICNMCCCGWAPRHANPHPSRHAGY